MFCCELFSPLPCGAFRAALEAVCEEYSFLFGRETTICAYLFKFCLHTWLIVLVLMLLRTTARLLFESAFACFAPVDVIAENNSFSFSSTTSSAIEKLKRAVSLDLVLVGDLLFSRQKAPCLTSFFFFVAESVMTCVRGNFSSFALLRCSCLLT